MRARPLFNTHMVYGWGAHGLDQFVCARLLDKMFGASIPTVKEKTIDDYHTMQMLWGERR